MKSSALRRLRLVSIPEAISFLVLLTCSVLKRTTEFNAVPVMGAIHGVLFVLYGVLWLDAWNKARWTRKHAVLYMVLAVVPAGGFFADRMLRAEEQVATDKDDDPAGTEPATA